MDLQASIDFIPQADVEVMLDLDREALEELSDAKVLLSLKLSDGELVFPAFQFQAGSLHPRLIVSFQKFDATTDGWFVASWFHRWNENLRSIPARLIEESNGIERIILAITTEQSLAKL